MEEIFAVCTHYAIDGETGPLDESHFASASETTATLNADGFRVIAVAYKEMPPDAAGLFRRRRGRADFARLHRVSRPAEGKRRRRDRGAEASGVQVKILTGDNDIVTRKICQEVGLAVDRILLGREIEALVADRARRSGRDHGRFAKLSPSQKAAIIDALHRNGHVVGFLGDGINDGPALKAADVGISVDTAVDIAKESADIILLEKSLLVLGEGVIEGRKVFGNITRYVPASGSPTGFTAKHASGPLGAAV